MVNEVQKISGYFDRKTAFEMNYRNYMEKQVIIGTNIINSLDKVQGSISQMHTGIRTSINDQTIALVASQEALASTFNHGFDRINNTLDMGFYGISNQLGHMTASFSMGFARVENALGKMTDIMSNPLLTQFRELYNRAENNTKKGFFQEALEDTQAAIEKNKTDYTAWFLQGKIYALGVSKYGNVIDLDKSIDALSQAAKYIEPDINVSSDTRQVAAEIYFYLGIAQFSKSNDMLWENKKDESSEMLINARNSFEQSFQFSKNMFESLFNLARCKTIQGETDSAIKDLERIVHHDRNYCIKICEDDDFSCIKDILINKLKNSAFIHGKKEYDRINPLVSELAIVDEQINILKSDINSLGGNIPTLRSEIASSGGISKTHTLPNFTKELPYFDILDYTSDFIHDIPILKKKIAIKKDDIETLKKLKEAKNQQKTREVKNQQERTNELMQQQKQAEQQQKQAEQQKKWSEQGLCKYCGGKLGGIFQKKCKSCGLNMKQN